MKVVIIKYNAGNIQSVRFALNRLNVESAVSDDPEIINKADKIIFPGVGEASSAMNYLKKHNLDSVLKNIRQPLLGICLGLQLLCKFSEENQTDCLNIVPLRVKKFPAKDKIPHMGWNRINNLKGPLFNSVMEGSFLYFVHSYFAENDGYTIATTNYIQPFSAAIQKDNFFAVQFHPEKSAAVGEQILNNFLKL